MDTNLLTGCAPPIEREQERLSLLHALALLDTEAEPCFDAITQLAAQLTGRPIALIGLVDAARTWFKSRVGLAAVQSPRDISFCGHAITGAGLFEVPDAHADPRFAANPLVTGVPFVRFYAGVPLKIAGLPMGTVCVVDHVPYQLSHAQREGLEQLGLLATELLERRLATRAKSEFIGHMNHEMRTPLNAILGFGQVLQLQSPPDSPAARHAQHIVDAGQHLLALIDESLDLLRIEAGTTHFEIVDVEVLPVLASVRQLVGAMAQQRGMALRIDAQVPVAVRGDPRRVKQVLVNLATNAIKYGGAGSEVVLSAGRRDGEAWVSVRDGGPGLTPEQIGRLFRPFERLGRERSGVAGTGLGLALSQQLAEGMGGRLEVQSAPGQGSVFTLALQAA